MRWCSSSPSGLNPVARVILAGRYAATAYTYVQRLRHPPHGCRGVWPPGLDPTARNARREQTWVRLVDADGLHQDACDHALRTPLDHLEDVRAADAADHQEPID